MTDPNMRWAAVGVADDGALVLKTRTDGTPYLCMTRELAREIVGHVAGTKVVKAAVVLGVIAICAVCGIPIREQDARIGDDQGNIWCEDHGSEEYG